MRLKKIVALVFSMLMVVSSLSITKVSADETDSKIEVSGRYQFKTKQDFNALNKGQLVIDLLLEINKLYSENIAAYQLELQLTDENGQVVSGMQENDVVLGFDSEFTKQDIKEYSYDPTTGMIKIYVATTRNLVQISEDQHILNIGSLTINTTTKNNLKVTVANDNGNFKAVLQDRSVVPNLKENENLKIISDGTIILTSMPENIDLTGLEKAIEKADQFIQEKQYTSDNTTASSWQAYIEAYNNAKNVLDHFETTMDQTYVIMITNELDLAVANITLRINQSVFDQLVNTVETAKNLMTQLTQSQKDTLQTFIDEANRYIDSGIENIATSETQNVMQLITQLNQSMSEFSQDLSVQKSILTDNINLLKEILQNADQYTENSINDLEALIEEATKVLNNPNSNIEDIKAMIAKTNDALLNVSLKVNKDQLGLLIEQATKLKRKDYTKESYDHLLSVLSQVEAVYKDENATQEQVDEAVSLLEEAIKNLEIVETAGTTSKTGDQTQLSLMLSLFGVSVVSIALLYAVKKRSELISK